MILNTTFSQGGKFKPSIHQSVNVNSDFRAVIVALEKQDHIAVFYIFYFACYGERGICVLSIACRHQDDSDKH